MPLPLCVYVCVHVGASPYIRPTEPPDEDWSANWSRVPAPPHLAPPLPVLDSLGALRKLIHSCVHYCLAAALHCPLRVVLRSPRCIQVDQVSADHARPSLRRSGRWYRQVRKNSRVESIRVWRFQVVYVLLPIRAVLSCVCTEVRPTARLDRSFLSLSLLRESTAASRLSSLSTRPFLRDPRVT